MQASVCNVDDKQERTLELCDVDGMHMDIWQMLLNSRIQQMLLTSACISGADSWTEKQGHAVKLTGR